MSVPPPPSPPPPPPPPPPGGDEGAGPGSAAAPFGVPAPPGPPPTWEPTVPPKRNGLALAAMILGLVGLLLCFTGVVSLLAVVLGLVAARQVKRSDGAQTGLSAARVGWITGIVGVALFATFIGLGLSGVFDDDEVEVFDLEIGTCVLLDDLDAGDGSVDRLPSVDCDEPHDGEVFLVGELNPDRDLEYPSDDELFAQVAARCEDTGPDAPILRYLDVDPEALGEWLSFRIAPDEDAWEATRGSFVCIVARADGRRTAGPFADDG